MNEDIFDELVTLEMFNETTRLCIYPPKKTLYIIKRVPVELKSVYTRIADIDNHNIAKVHIIRTVEDHAFIVRDYISGETLSDVIASGKIFSETTAARIVTDVCTGLKGLHGSDIVHRDVNPNNIIITPTGNACIIDYGIARSFKQQKSADTYIMGTPGYAAPEQFGFAQSTEKADIYAVGVLLNVLLTGKHPSEQLADGGLGRIVKKCVEVDQRRRYSSTDRIIEELKKYIGNDISYNSKAWYVKLMLAFPGIRSEKLWVKIISVPLYIIFFAFTYILYNPGRSFFAGFQRLLFWPFFTILTWLLPFALLFDFANIRQKIPLVRKLPTWAQIVVCLHFSIGLFIFGSIVMAYLH